MTKEYNGPEVRTGTQTNQPPLPDTFPNKLAAGDFPHPPQRDKAAPPATKENVAHLLQESGIRVGYDVIGKRLSLERNGQSLTVKDIVSLATLNGMRDAWLIDYVQDLGEANPINPVQDWIRSKAWDRTDRVTQLIATITVEEDYPADFAGLLVRYWLLSATAAACIPDGFHTRGVLTLQGGQGIGKSSWFGALVPAELSNRFMKLDHHLDPHNKDSVLGAIVHWIVEMGELDSTFRKDVARLKGFLTNSCDKVRPPYGKTAIEMPRRTVFGASVNDLNFLVDTTGNSRWWTIPVVALDFEHGIDMQQVFAQLAVAIDAGAQWWLPQELEQRLETENRRFRAVSVIEERITERLAPEGSEGKTMTARQLLMELGVMYPTNPQCREAGSVLRSLYGNPKRVRGRDCWKVALLSSGAAERNWETVDDIY